MLDKIRPARKFDGFDFVIERDEFDGLMAAFEEVIKAHQESIAITPNEGFLNYINPKIRTKENILKFSYFDPVNKSVYIRLDMTELRDVMETLMIYSAYMAIMEDNEKEVTFEKMIAKDTTKFWKNS